jgi:MFS family permease
VTPARARANVRRMYLWQFLTSLHFFAGVLIPFFTDWGGITFTQVMWLQTWFVFWIFVLEVPTGAVADHLGRRASCLCASACLVAAVLLYPMRKSLGNFLLAEFVWAAALAFSSGADEAMVYDSLKCAGLEDEAKAALGRQGSCQILGIAVAAPLGSLIGAHWGMTAPLRTGAIPFALSFLLMLSLEEPPVPMEERRRYWEGLTRGVRYFAAHPALRRMAWDAVSVWTFSFMAIWLYQPHLRALGYPLAWLGLVATGATLLQVLVLHDVERVERLCGGPRRYLLLSSLVPAAGWLLLAFAHRPLWAVPFFVLIPGIGLSRLNIASAYMNKHVGSSMRATVMSSVGMSRQLVCGLVYPLVGWGAQRSIPATCAALGAVALASALLSPLREADLA